MGFLNPDGHFNVRPTKLEDAEGISEKIDPDIKEVFENISRKELGIPSHALKAGAFQYSLACFTPNMEYLLCKAEEGDPRTCLKYGNDVSDCASDFYKKITDGCQETFVKFAQCLEHNHTRTYGFCRPEQVAFDHCAFHKLGFDKAKNPVFPDTKIKTDRPKRKNPHFFENYESERPLPPDWNRPLPKFDE